MPGGRVRVPRRAPGPPRRGRRPSDPAARIRTRSRAVGGTIVGVGTIGDYLAGLEADQRAALQHVVDVAARLAPEAEEGTSYGMPALRLDGRPLVGVTAAAKHLSLFPFSPAVVEAVAPDLDGFSLSKGTIRFTVERQVPDAVLERVVALRLAELRA
ncbi:MAG: DUF1801 domain-containing protein [Dermatophilaceae bacterium]|nr:DUF1801 domain-containing protein [Dermatophilaceae bacterium]